jgi:hypothetical protein
VSLMPWSYHGARVYAGMSGSSWAGLSETTTSPFELLCEWVGVTTVSTTSGSSSSTSVGKPFECLNAEIARGV